MKKFFTGAVRFCVDNGDIRLLNRLRKFILTDIRLDGERLCFTVALEYRREIIKILGKRDFTFYTNRNVFSVLNFFYARVALVLTAVAAFATFIVLGQVIFRVQIKGIDGEERSEVMQYLNANGIHRLAFKNKSMNTVMDRALESNFDFIAHASSRMVGNTLIISIYRAENVGQIPDGSNLISRYDCVIVSVTVLGGTALVTPGDVVRKGDILIQGIHQIDETEFAPCLASGIVMGEIKFAKSAVVATGTEDQTAAELLGKIILESGIKAFDRTDVYVTRLTENNIAVEVVATVVRNVLE